MILSLIVAADEADVIGVDGRLPWRLPRDLRAFRDATAGRPVIMGRRTLESLGGELPGRANVLVSTTAPGAARSFSEALDRAEAACAPGPAAEAFVIGGAALYSLAAARADRAYVTRVHTRVDTAGARRVARLPWFAIEARVREVLSRAECPAGDGEDFAWTRTVYALGELR